MTGAAFHPTAGRLVAILHELIALDDLEEVLRRVLTAAQELTGAQYAAIGVLNEQRDGLARFITVGIDEEGRALIGGLPQGHGVLGELISHPQILRVGDVSLHPRSYGFPLGHPPMTTFLGGPIVIRGESYGNIYLTEKAGGGEFDDADEQLLAILAEYAAIGIDHARRFDRLERRREELERTVAAFGATDEISRALAGEVDLEPILELVAKRGRALVAARTLVILLPGHDGLRVAHVAGEAPEELLGQSVPEAELTDGLARLGLTGSAPLRVPLAFRGRRLGVLIAFDRLQAGPRFSATDEQLLTSFATIAAAAVGAAQALSAERQRERAAAAEAERRRWARELHDETLQGIAAVRLQLASSRRFTEDEMRAMVAVAADDLQDEVDRLRDIIHDVRPSSLDDLGLMAAMEALVARHANNGGPALALEVDLDHEAGRAPERLHPDVEIAIYRIAQEALTNALKHADAQTVQIAVAEIGGEVGVRIRDDGSGYDVREGSAALGFGLVSVQERVDLLGGRLRITSAPGDGTTLEARVPSRHREPA
jgi:signal transduction histidine kinase